MAPTISIFFHRVIDCHACHKKRGVPPRDVGRGSAGLYAFHVRIAHRARYTCKATVRVSAVEGIRQDGLTSPGDDVRGVAPSSLRYDAQNADAFCRTNRLSSAIEHTIHSKATARVALLCMARPTGFEPVTPAFGGRYSIQLSYGRIRGTWNDTGSGASRHYLTR